MQTTTPTGHGPQQPVHPRHAFPAAIGEPSTTRMPPGTTPPLPSPPLPRTQPPTPSVSPAAEALGYAGGLLTTTAVLHQLSDVWSSLHAGTQTGLLTLATAVLAAAAGVIGDRDAVASRLSTTLWVMAGISSTLTAYLALDSLAGLGADAGLVAAGSTAAAGASVLWRRTGRDGFGAIAYLSALTALFGGVGVLGGEDLHRVLVTWGAGVAWVIAAASDWLPSRRLSVALGAVTTMGAAQAVAIDAYDAGLVLGLASMALLTVFGVSSQDRFTGGWAVFAGIVFVPQAAFRWIPHDLALPLVSLVGGLVLLACCIWMVTRDRRRGAAPRTG